MKPSTLRQVIALKQRRMEGLEEAVREARLACAQADQAASAAEGRLLKAQTEHGEELDRLLGAMSGGGAACTSQHLIVRQMLLKAAEQVVAGQQREVQQAQAVQAQARDGLRQANVAVARAQSQLDVLKERLREALQAIEQAAEDLQDEESEETAVARLVARAAQAKKASARALAKAR